MYAGDASYMSLTLWGYSGAYDSLGQAGQHFYYGFVVNGHWNWAYARMCLKVIDRLCYASIRLHLQKPVPTYGCWACCWPWLRWILGPSALVPCHYWKDDLQASIGWDVLCHMQSSLGKCTRERTRGGERGERGGPRGGHCEHGQQCMNQHSVQTSQRIRRRRRGLQVLLVPGKSTLVKKSIVDAQSIAGSLLHSR